MQDITYPLIAAALAFGSVLLAVTAVFGIIGVGTRIGRLRSKVDSASGAAGDPVRSGLQMVTGLLKANSSDFLGRIGRHLGEQDPATASKLRLKLMRAGYRQPNAAVLFIGTKVLLVVVCLASFLVFKLVAPDMVPGGLVLLGAVSFAMAGYYAPMLWLNQKVAKRKIAILKELPDTLDLLVVCVEAGMGLDQAISRVADEVRHSCPLMSEEFKVLNLELRAGKSRKDGLRNLSLRIDLDDMDSLVTLLIQADSFGTSMATTLRVYSDTLRTKRFQRAEELAAKLPVKLLFPLVLFILPALFVVIIGPAVIQLMGVFAKM